MKRKLAMMGTAALAAGLVTACGGGSDDTATTSAPVSNQALDTAQVLAQARTTSESASPFAVDDGALVLTDTSESSEPASVNGM
jgi:hypothetical protein